MQKTILEIIKEKTVEVGDCLEWTGYVHPTYGNAQTSQKGRSVRVIRLMAIRLGLNPGKRVVTNCCGNKLCVSPDHLRIMSRKQRSKQIIAQANKTPKLNLRRAAANRKKSKLTFDDVFAIRQIEGKTQKEIAQMYGISPRAVWNILNNKTWKADLRSPFAYMSMALAA